MALAFLSHLGAFQKRLAGCCRQQNVEQDGFWVPGNTAPNRQVSTVAAQL